MDAARDLEILLRALSSGETAIEALRAPGRCGRTLPVCLAVALALFWTSSLLAQSSTEARPISPPSTPLELDRPDENDASDGRSLGTTAAALGAILLLFFGLVQIWRRYSPRPDQTLPAAAWEVLGSAPLDNRHELTVVRLGSRLLVLGRSEQGLQTLSEITSGEEVSQLVALCQSTTQAAESNSFRQLYDNFRSQLGLSPAEADNSPAQSSNGGTHRA